jgi:hypothetical protein
MIWIIANIHVPIVIKVPIIDVFHIIPRRKFIEDLGTS